jgi:hypothetical protein
LGFKAMGSSIKGVRNKARLNLIVATINVAIERRLISLDCQPIADTTFEFELAGLPVLASVTDIGFGDVSVKALVAPTELGRRFVKPALFHGHRRFGVATGWGVLERQTGRYLQTIGSYRGAKVVTGKLSELTIAPNGFGLKPTRGGYYIRHEHEAVFGPPRPRPPIGLGFRRRAHAKSP